jgi:hypothetical protein
MCNSSLFVQKHTLGNGGDNYKWWIKKQTSCTKILNDCSFSTKKPKKKKNKLVCTWLTYHVKILTLKQKKSSQFGHLNMRAKEESVVTHTWLTPQLQTFPKTHHNHSPPTAICGALLIYGRSFVTHKW